jgi:hypothetical protein
LTWIKHASINPFEMQVAGACLARAEQQRAFLTYSHRLASRKNATGCNGGELIASVKTLLKAWAAQEDL